MFQQFQIGWGQINLLNYVQTRITHMMDDLGSQRTHRTAPLFLSNAGWTRSRGTEYSTGCLVTWTFVVRVRVRVQLVQFNFFGQSERFACAHVRRWMSAGKQVKSLVAWKRRVWKKAEGQTANMTQGPRSNLRGACLDTWGLRVRHRSPLLFAPCAFPRCPLSVVRCRDPEPNCLNLKRFSRHRYGSEQWCRLSLGLPLPWCAERDRR